MPRASSKFPLLVGLIGLRGHGAFTAAHQEPGRHAAAGEQDHEAHRQHGHEQTGALDRRARLDSFFGNGFRRGQGGSIRLRVRWREGRLGWTTTHGRRRPRSGRQLAGRFLGGRTADGRRLLPGSGGWFDGLRLDERHEVADMRRPRHRRGFRLGGQHGDHFADRAGLVAVARSRRLGWRRRLLCRNGKHLPALRVGAAHGLTAQRRLNLVTSFTGRTDGGDQHGCHPRT